MRSMLFALLLVAQSSLAAFAADDLCVEAPPLNVPLPTWWTGLSENTLETRWANATPFEGGRVLWDNVGKRLFFEVNVAGDTSLDAADDLVAIALTDVNGAPSMYIELAPMVTCAVTDCSIPTAFADVRYARRLASGFGWGKKTTNVVLSTVRAEHADVTVVDNGASFDYRVRFTLRFPIDPILGQADADQRIYLNVIHEAAGVTTSTVYENPALCESTSPTTNDCLVMDWETGTISLPADLPLWDILGMWPRVVTGPSGSCL